MKIENCKTILLVEDEAIIAMLEVNILNKYGFKVITANSGEKAIETVEKNNDIDLILMDINLGEGIDGTEAAEIILDKRDCPIIFLSSHTEKEVVDKTEGITSYGYIVKNSGETVLIASIKMAFKLFDAKLKELEKERALKLSEQKFRIFADYTYDWEYWEDTDGRIIYISPSSERISGYSPEEYKSDNLLMKKILHPDDEQLFNNHYKKTHSCEYQSLIDEIDFRIVRKDGKTVYINHLCRPIYDDNGNFFGRRVSNRDITERKHVEDALHNLNRELCAISNCNQILVRSDDEQSLLDNICSIICEEAGYDMAWIGFIENRDKMTINPVSIAVANNGNNDLAVIDREEIIGWDISLQSIIHDEKTTYIQEIMPYTDVYPWHDKALQHGYKSIVTFPLKNENAELFGILSIYSTKSNIFFPEEIRLLEELAGDLAFGIITLRIREERRINAEIIASQLYLIQYSLDHSLDDLLEETLNETEKITGSLIGFYHFVNDDQKTLTLQNWSTRTKNEFCNAEGKGSHYAITDAGVWVDCVHQHKPVIHNDYAALAHKKGMPEGHAEVKRELVVPVLRSGLIKAILGVGNKSADYTEKDIENVTILADLAWEIAERKKAEESLKKLLDVNQTLLTELQHRAKNNFRSISDILELATISCNSAPVKSVLQGFSARVNAISEMYDLLYSSGSVDNVQLDDYISRIVSSLLPISGGIVIQYSCDSFKTTFKTAIPAGIIITELITNSFRHAYAGKKSGVVNLSVKKITNEVFIEVSDNGTGLPEGFSISTIESIGLKLVYALVDQINGTIKIENMDGMRCIISFPLEPGTHV